MSIILEYKGFYAKMLYDHEDDIVVGEVLYIADSLVFHSNTFVESEKVFHEVIDDYLELCEELGKTPERKT